MENAHNPDEKMSVEVGNEISASTERPWFIHEDENSVLSICQLDCSKRQHVGKIIAIMAASDVPAQERFENANLIVNSINQYCDLRTAVTRCLEYLLLRRDKRSTKIEVSLQQKCKAALQVQEHWEQLGAAESRSRIAADDRFIKQEIERLKGYLNANP